MKNELRISPTVMIVEGCALTRHGLASLLQEQGGYEICGQTGDIRHARQLCEAMQPGLIVLDPELPEGYAAGLLRDFATLHPPARTLIVSLREDALSLQRVFQAGARGYVSKRDEPQEVLNGLEKLRAGAFFASRRVAHLLLEHLATGKMRAPGRGLETLSAREWEVFRHLGAGRKNREIAEKMGLSIKTIETHCQRMKDKLSLPSSAALQRCGTTWAATRKRKP